MGLTVKDILLILLGFALANAAGWFDRRRKIKTHWHALRAEIILAMRQARDFLDSDVMSPLYRYPTDAFEKAFRLLLVEGAVGEEEFLVLNLLFSAVQEH